MSVLSTMPASGRVIVAAPSSEEAAQYAAFELGLDYLLDPFVPCAQVYMLDVTRCWQLEEEWIRSVQPSTHGPVG